MALPLPLAAHSGIKDSGLEPPSRVTLVSYMT